MRCYSVYITTYCHCRSAPRDSCDVLHDVFSGHGLPGSGLSTETRKLIVYNDAEDWFIQACDTTLMVQCKTAVSPLLTHWRYCSLALSHRHVCACKLIHHWYSNTCIKQPLNCVVSWDRWSFMAVVFYDRSHCRRNGLAPIWPKAITWMKAD